MNLERLYQILGETTIQLRKGAEIEGDPELVKAITDMKPGDDVKDLPGGTASIYAMPHVDQAPVGLVKVDLHFITIGVDMVKAEAIKAELVAILNTYPRPDRLAGGPSYIEVGGVIGDQGATLCLFALGQALKLWQVITPAKLGITGASADQMAGLGFIMIDGYKAA